jgi:hypothetical protein
LICFASEAAVELSTQPGSENAFGRADVDPGSAWMAGILFR